MTNSLGQILDEAERLLERNQYSEAHDHFRRAVLLAPPNAATLANWQISELEERLAFMRRVAEVHPRDVDCQLALANELIKYARGAQAVILCGDLLKLTDEPRKQLLVRFVRLQAAVDGNRFASFVEDFAFIWRSRLRGAEHFRKRSLRIIASLDCAKAISSVEAICLDDELPSEVGAFLVAKLAELQALCRCPGLADVS